MRQRRRPVLLDERILFPPPEHADPEGLLAVGGDLCPERLLAAYRAGIFPWPLSDSAPMLWWSPDPRFVLYPAELEVSRSLEQRIRSGRFRVSLDRAFEPVIRNCAAVPRADQEGTWITEEVIDAYLELHRLGWAHSVESWTADGNELAGGLYGVAIGSAFFGESMFHHKTDASKVAFATLVRRLKEAGFTLIDCQIETAHLARLGARPIPRPRFLAELKTALSAVPPPFPT